MRSNKPAWPGKMAYNRYTDDHYIPDPPCTFCAHARRCRDERMACYRFARYSGTMPVSARDRKRFQADPESPSRELYALLFPGDGPEGEFPVPNFLKKQAE